MMPAGPVLREVASGVHIFEMPPTAIRSARRIRGTNDAPYSAGGYSRHRAEPVARSTPITLPPLTAALYQLELT